MFYLGLLQNRYRLYYIMYENSRIKVKNAIIENSVLVLH